MIWSLNNKKQTEIKNMEKNKTKKTQTKQNNNNKKQKKKKTNKKQQQQTPNNNDKQIIMHWNFITVSETAPKLYVLKYKP